MTNLSYSQLCKALTEALRGRILHDREHNLILCHQSSADNVQSIWHSDQRHTAQHSKLTTVLCTYFYLSMAAVFILILKLFLKMLRHLIICEMWNCSISHLTCEIQVWKLWLQWLFVCFRILMSSHCWIQQWLPNWYAWKINASLNSISVLARYLENTGANPALW